MTGALVMATGIALIVSIFMILVWIGERRDRKSAGRSR